MLRRHNDKRFIRNNFTDSNNSNGKLIVFTTYLFTITYCQV